MMTSLILYLLSDDLLFRILDCVSEDSDRKSFRATCKSFHRIESGHRTRLKFLRPEFIPGLLRKYSRADTLDFSVCPRIYDGTVSVLLNNLNCLGWAERVRKVVLSRTTSLRVSGLEMLVGSCPRLEVIDVSHCCQFGDREASALLGGKELKEVKMDKCLRVSDVGLTKIAIWCTKLEKISLKWCLEITDLGIHLLSNKSTHLKHLSVSYLKITNESLRSISNMKNLEALMMVGCGLVGDEGLHFLGNGCPSLKVLDVSRCEHVSSAGLISVTRGCKSLQKLNAGYYFLELSSTVFHSLKDLKNLKTIRVDGARVTESFFQIISTNCSLLVEVGLSKCEGVNDVGIMQLASGRPNLKILDLTCCNDLTDMSILAVAHSCTTLVCLKLESCSLLTERSFSYISSSCHLLEELDLTECCVNDRGLEYLSKCVELRCLRLGICTDISGKGLSYIASHCKKLKELDLYRCLNVGDDGLGFIASGCKKIIKLNLCYCTKITDKGMAHLIQLEELSDLEMRSISEVTSVGLTALASGCRKLSELDIKHCGNISDAGFWSLAYYSWNLQQINLSFRAVSDVGLCMMMAIENAKSEIYVTGWWLCPELYLKRPFHANGSSRLDALFEAKAKEGVKIYILLYKEVAIALKINSLYSQKRLLNIHENVKVLRYPDHFAAGIYLWSHHEKIVVVDHQICFLGGLDLCFGRYDTIEHKVGDHPPFIWPGKDYYNPRESEPNSWVDTMTDELDRRKYPRMPWHDVHCALWGPPCRDVARHFVQRWNHAKRNKAPNEQTIPLLMPQQHMVLPHYTGRSLKLDIESKPIDGNQIGIAQDSFSYDSTSQDIQFLLPQEADGIDSKQVNNTLNGFQPRNHLGLSHGDHFSQTMQTTDSTDDFDSLDHQRSMGTTSFGSDLSDEGSERQLISSGDISQVGPHTSCSCQVIRSVCQWSGGTSQTEDSIHKAYCSLIENAEKFIYIENQFFISGLSDDDVIQNRVLETLYRRILRAHKEEKCFRVIIVIPLLPGFQGGLDDGGAATVRAIMHWQYRTISIGHNSILHNLNALIGPKTDDYISFYGLRTYGRLGDDGPIVTSQVYVHSKVMIVDDRITIIGSSNINDRSLLGHRDSEIGVIIED